MSQEIKYFFLHVEKVQAGSGRPKDSYALYATPYMLMDHCKVSFEKPHPDAR